ncbi:unnamed protein product, partial [Owenia fusiformis]
MDSMKEQTVCDCEKLTTSDVDGSTFDGPINKLKKTECIKWLLCRNIKPHHKDTLASLRECNRPRKNKPSHDIAMLHEQLVQHNSIIDFTLLTGHCPQNTGQITTSLGFDVPRGSVLSYQ